MAFEPDPFTQCPACYCQTCPADNGVWYCPWCDAECMVELSDSPVFSEEEMKALDRQFRPLESGEKS